MTSSLNVLVAGRMVGTPGQGGATWAVLQYLLGLRRLGHRVFFVEPLDPVAGDPAGAPPQPVSAYFRQVTERFDLVGDAALMTPDACAFGVPRETLCRRAREADLLLNLSGVLRDPCLTASIPVRAYVDLDPGFTQLWESAEGIDMGLEGHTHFVTVGLEIGRSSPIPTCGRSWIHTVPPVVLDEWPKAGRIERDAWTTVANWRAYGSVTHEGVLYGQKAHAIRELIDLPEGFRDPVHIALAIDPGERADLEALSEKGWTVLSPDRVSRGPDGYRSFVRGSRGELAVAKSGYVRSGSGWFSDRSACYLASGRPVIAQETGFGRHLPTGVGLWSFASCEAATHAAETVRCDYHRHSNAAREIAETHFAADIVLPKLLGALGATP